MAFSLSRQKIYIDKIIFFILHLCCISMLLFVCLLLFNIYYIKHKKIISKMHLKYLRRHKNENVSVEKVIDWFLSGKGNSSGTCFP